MTDQIIYVKRTPDDLPGGQSQCDFCSDPESPPTTMFPATAFIMSMITSEGSYTQNFMDDGWAACAWCELLVTANDIPRLVERYFIVHPMRQGMTPADRGFVRGLVSTQFDLFFEHKTGPGVPIPAVTP